MCSHLGTALWSPLLRIESVPPFYNWRNIGSAGRSDFPWCPELQPPSSQGEPSTLESPSSSSPRPGTSRALLPKWILAHIIPLLEALQGVPAPCSVNSRLLFLLPTRLACLPTPQFCSSCSVAVFYFWSPLSHLSFSVGASSSPGIVNFTSLNLVNSFHFRPHPLACGILVPWPRIEPMPLAGGVRNLNYWTARGSLK